MKQLLWAALLGSTALIPSIGYAQTAPATPPASAAQANACPDLVMFLEQRGTATPASPVTLEQARGFQRANDAAACRDALTRIRTAGIELPANLAAMLTPGTQTAGAPATTTPGTGERITVQQPAATLQVEQAPPQISVCPYCSFYNYESR